MTGEAQSSSVLERGMRIAELVAAFQAIESTRKRLQIRAILAELLRQGPEDADVLPSLLQGRLGPPYAAPNIGMDERRLAQAIAAAAGTPQDEVWRRYKQAGDLGLVAEQLLPPGGQAVSVREAFEQLRSIATTAGKGAYEQRVRLFRDLLRQLGGREARYVVRMAQGKLRLQVGDATVLDALATARGADATLRAQVERAYALCSDLGLVARTLLTAGPDGLGQIHSSPGRPVLAALAERLPSAQEVVRKLGRVLAEPRYDGLRLQAHKDGDDIWLFTRRLEDLTHAFPDIARAIRQQVRAGQAILDGEAVGCDPRTGRLPFQQTVRRRKHGVEAMEVRFPLRYFVFDLLYVDGRDCTPLPQQERSCRLREVVREVSDGLIQVARQLETDNAAALGRFFDETVGHRAWRGSW